MLPKRGGGRNDAEVRLRSRILGDAKEAGLWGSNVNDRFVSAKPDMRLAYREWGQLDVELKILGVHQTTIDSGREVLSGVTKLQEIELRDMNAHGAHAVGLILIPEYDLFVFCNFKTITPKHSLIGPWVEYTPAKKDGHSLNFYQLFRQAEKYLRSIHAW